MIKHSFLCILVVFSLFGCANPFSSDDSASLPDPYYDTFADIPIPRGLEANKADSSIIFGQNNMQTGVQLFKGRVEVSSLAATMAANMARDNWTLRSALRSVHTVLVFEKPDRFCTLYILDGMWSTSMRVFVTAKLTNGAIPMPSSAQAAASSSTSGGGVESYPAGGFSNSQPLNQ